MNEHESNRSAAGLLGQLAQSIPELFRKELTLFKAEMNEKAGKIGSAVGMIVLGVVLLLTALNVLAAALVRWVAAAGVDPGLAALFVGIGILVLAAILASKGISDLKNARFAPDRVQTNVRRDVNAIKEAVQ